MKKHLIQRTCCPSFEKSKFNFDYVSNYKISIEIKKGGWQVLVLVLAAQLQGPVINSHLTQAITEKLFLNLVLCN